MFHVTEDGPKKCSTTPDKCPITRDTDGDHYQDFSEAQSVYEKSQNSFSKPKKIGLPKINLIKKLQVKNHSTYALILESNEINEVLELWRKELDLDFVKELEDNKELRDGKNKYHITVITPQEFRKLRKDKVQVELNDYAFSVTGIGSVSDGENETWYLTISSHEIDKLREKLNLELHGLHSTIGFKNKDVHTVFKGQETRKFI